LLKEFAKEGDVVREKINHELIAGIKIIINDSRQFDASMQSKLQKIL
jgi:F0F1-type ATP synthase delta subunit